MTNRDTLLRGTHNNTDETNFKPQKGNSNKLNTCNWLSELPHSQKSNSFVEVRFKNTRKSFYQNQNELHLEIGDIVAVEANPGHDIGIISLIGPLVYNQIQKVNYNEDTEPKKVYRKVKQTDIDKWHEAISLEHNTMIKARQIANDLKLDMKIGDVEYQGDKTKAIFYYIADERVDFRELIKILAETFRIRIEMKQIGARQEAGRIGGIGSCGRELCCSTWISNFISVTTNAARYQEVSLNPQKLAGQCSKLKCCLNYELECYLDAQKNFPPKEVNLETKDGTAYYQKTDIYRNLMWYSFDPVNAINLTAVPVERVKEIININKKGQKVPKLVEVSENSQSSAKKTIEYKNDVGTESLERFDNKKIQKNNKKRRKKNFRKKENTDAKNTN